MSERRVSHVTFSQLELNNDPHLLLAVRSSASEPYRQHTVSSARDEKRRQEQRAWQARSEANRDGQMDSEQRWAPRQARAVSGVVTEVSNEGFLWQCLSSECPATTA